jgi:hypothetical protein
MASPSAAPSESSENAAAPQAPERTTSSSGTVIAAAVKVVFDCAKSSTPTPRISPSRCSQRRSKGWCSATSR